jgi:hypothetical protein
MRFVEVTVQETTVCPWCCRLRIIGNPCRTCYGVHNNQHTKKRLTKRNNKT